MRFAFASLVPCAVGAALAACGDDSGPGGADASGAGPSSSASEATTSLASTTSGMLPDVFDVSGMVVDQDGSPVEGAIVMQGGGSADFLTGSDGTFTISLTQAIAGAPTVVAAKVGYRSAGEEIVALPIPDVTLTLFEVEPPDNVGYEYGHPGVGDPDVDISTLYCGHCHTTFAAQFQTSAHARSARSPLVQDLYAGVAASATSAAACASLGGTWRTGTLPGSPGQATQRCYIGDGVLDDLNGCGAGLACDDPALPQPQKPTVFGACADCHALGMAGQAGGRDLLEATGYAYDYGNHCDACHHVRDVDLAEPPGAAGRLVVQRPREKIGDPIQGQTRQAMFGPYPDVPNTFMGGSYQPKFSSSEFCAGCHEQAQPALMPGASLDPARWPDGLPVHATYSEWLGGPFNAPATQCQYCHMPAQQGLFNPMDVADAESAGITFGFQRQPDSIRSHWFRGPLTEVPGSPRLLDGAVGVEIAAGPVAGDLEVSVTVRNQACGHAIPTGEPMRALVLWVGAEGCSQTFSPVGGQTIDPAGGALATGTAAVDAAFAGTSLGWPAGAAVAQPGQVVRVVRPTGTFLDYEGVGLFAGTTLPTDQKGLELVVPVGEASAVAVAGSVVTLSAPVPAAPGDVVFLGDAVGPTIADGDPARALAGASGATFAKILVDPFGRERVPHHRAVDIRRDNRIPPASEAVTAHTFDVPPGCTQATVRAVVLYRPHPVELSKERGWDARDWVAADVSAAVTLP